MIASEDYLLRQIVQLVEAVNAIIRGTPSDVPEEEIIEGIDAAYEELLGPNRALVAMLDTESGARLIGEPFRVRAYVDLLLADAAYRRQRGAAQEAAELAGRADAFLGTLPPNDGAGDGDRHRQIAALLATHPYR